MSDHAGAQAISAVNRGDVVELTSARTFAVPSSDRSTVYLVTLAVIDGEWRASCTCEAGRHGTRCWHARAARIAARSTRPPILLAEDADTLEPEPRVGDLEPDRL